VEKFIYKGVFIHGEELKMATVAQEKRWQAELEIIQEVGEIPSCRKMQALLLEKKGIKVSFNVINIDLKKDLETLTEDEYKNKKGGILSMLEDEIVVAHKIAMHSAEDKTRLDAMNTVSKLSKTKSDVIIKFRKAQIEINKEDKPKYYVSIGKPRSYEKETKKNVE